MRKKIKRAQALVETIVVLSIYFFMLSFIISGYQLMYNKTIVNIAAYEQARAVVAHESAKKFIKDLAGKTLSLSTSGKKSEEYGKEIGEMIVKENFFANEEPFLIGPVVEVYGIRANQVGGDGRDPYDINVGAGTMYVQATIDCDMTFLFPIVSTDLSGIVADKAHIHSAFTIAKERMY